MRYRHRETLLTGPDCTTRRFPVSCANRTEQPIAISLGTKWLGRYEATYDTCTEHYFKLRKAGKSLPLNPFSSRKTEAKVLGSTSMRVTTVADACSGPGIKSWYQNDGAFLTQNIWPSMSAISLPAVDPNAVSNLLAETQTRALADRQNGIANFAESLAEIDKAFKMVGSPLQNVSTFIRDFRKNGKRLRGWRNVAADSLAMIRFTSAEWLRFRYGITPLIADARAAMKALERGYGTEAKVYTARAKAKAPTSQSFSTGSFLGGGGAYRVRYQITTQANFTARAFYRDEYVQSPWNNVGLSYHNILGLGWELTHFSFVVDWFANVGDVIYANIPRVGLVPKGGQRTMKFESIAVLSPVGLDSLTPLSQTVTGSIGDTCTVSQTELRRENIGYESELVIKGDFRLTNWIRASDAAAVVVQLLGSISFQSNRNPRFIGGGGPWLGGGR